MVLSCTKYGHLDPYLFTDLMAIIRLHSQLQIISILTRYFIFCKSEKCGQIKVFILFKNVIPLSKSVKNKGSPIKCILLYSAYCEIVQLVKMYLIFDDIVPIVFIPCNIKRDFYIDAYTIYYRIQLTVWTIFAFRVMIPHK